MLQKVKLNTPDGIKDYPFVPDSVSYEAALASGEITGVAIDRYGTIYISEDLMDKVVPDSVAEGYELEVVG